jgi:hypothetical protein
LTAEHVRLVKRLDLSVFSAVILAAEAAVLAGGGLGGDPGGGA